MAHCEQDAHTSIAIKPGHPTLLRWSRPAILQIGPLVIAEIRRLLSVYNLLLPLRTYRYHDYLWKHEDCLCLGAKLGDDAYNIQSRGSSRWSDYRKSSTRFRHH